MTNSFIKCMAALFVFTQLAACDSGLNRQIDKCVEAGMEANKPFKNNTEKADTEIQVRAYCMRAAAGKD